jgi:hypothetical protein
MDHHLEARWRARLSPFDREILYLDDYLPIAQLRMALVALVAVLQQHEQAASLYTLPDWHEHGLDPLSWTLSYAAAACSTC